MSSEESKETQIIAPVSEPTENITDSTWQGGQCRRARQGHGWSGGSGCQGGQGRGQAQGGGRGGGGRGRGGGKGGCQG